MIGWYVHHHGSGHLHRMAAVTRRLGEPVTVLSSLPPPANHPGVWIDWIQLTRDDDAPAGNDPDLATTVVSDPEAHGTLHWVPRHHTGLARRAAQITDWCARANPSLMVVDVSVEVTLLARLCGVPVAVVAMPGDRTDRAHTLAYDQAELLLAPWPRGLPTDWPSAWQAKTVCTGAIGRFDDRIDRPSGPRVPGTGLVLWGHGGDAAVDLGTLHRATPDRQWTVATPRQPLTAEQVWTELGRSEVVLTHAGQNAVAEVAAARAAAIVVADQRPFGEQHHTVQRLDTRGIAVALASWPEPERWPTLVDAAIDRGGEGWKEWNDGQGASRAADALEELVHESRRSR